MEEGRLMQQRRKGGFGRLGRHSMLVLAATFVALPVWPDDAGKIASTVCAPCHAPDGNSVIPNFPKIAGQQASYLAKQLNDFLAGKRKSDAMVPTLASVKPGQFQEIASWFAAQKQARGKVEDPVLAAAGKKLFTDGNDATGVPACAGCHGEDGLGNDRNPRIAGQHQTYALKEMADFKSGARANDKGRVMRVVAERLTEAEMKAVAEYMAGL